MASLVSSLFCGHFCLLLRVDQPIMGPALGKGLSFPVLPRFKAMSSALCGHECPNPWLLGLTSAQVPLQCTGFRYLGPFLSVLTMELLKIKLYTGFLCFAVEELGSGLGPLFLLTWLFTGSMRLKPHEARDHSHPRYCRPWRREQCLDVAVFGRLSIH